MVNTGLIDVSSLLNICSHSGPELVTWHRGEGQGIPGRLWHCMQIQVRLSFNNTDPSLLVDNSGTLMDSTELMIQTRGRLMMAPWSTQAGIIT